MGIPGVPAKGISALPVGKRMAQELNPHCNCPKTECPRHGDCMACVEAHKAVEGGKIPYCLRFMVKVQGI